MKTESGINTRALVLDILLEMEKGQEYGSLLLKNVLDKYDYLESRDKAFIKRLTRRRDGAEDSAGLCPGPFFQNAAGKMQAAHTQSAENGRISNPFYGQCP